MSTIDQIHLNRMVQGIEERGAFFSMFDAADEARRRELLRTATRMAEQAGAKEEDVSAAIVDAGVNPRRTSAVVAGLPPLRQNIWRLSSLPMADLSDGIRLMLALFAIADARRRATVCANGCSHWWHGDLSDTEALLAALEAPE